MLGPQNYLDCAGGWAHWYEVKLDCFVNLLYHTPILHSWICTKLVTSYLVNLGCVSGIHFSLDLSLTQAGAILQTLPLLISCLVNNEKWKIMVASWSSLAHRASDLKLKEEPTSPALMSSKQGIFTETYRIFSNCFLQPCANFLRKVNSVQCPVIFFVLVHTAVCL